MTDTHEVTVRSVHQMTPSVKQFVLESDGYQFDFEPGQHTHVHFDRAESPAVDDAEPDDEEVVRPYTSTAMPGTERITLAIKRYPDGTASTWMHERDPGDRIEIEELDGNLFLRDLDADAAFVATGTGVTPMIAMAKQYVREATGTAHFFFGETDEEHLFYRETLDQLAADYPSFDVTYVLSQADEEWRGPEGHVQDHLAEHLDDFEERDFYVCGVPEMVVETREYLADRGVDEDRVYVEGWEGDEVSDGEG
ncbi:ferredoxin--NADP reductase [Halorussus sp. MSC15.2]|uniref:ferredoxin--NADP reductase n=1 Tax=Halorussus sp. MSC15.2 TaxID=2283638 RepID=UPI0013D0BFB4|nr:FAD-binding oxidoreductase [Halorussus sp. MSC15.2]NEU57500.1 phenol hydroxylase [Halorussus sp. MSC15.2]